MERVEESPLSKGVSSLQAALDLATAQRFLDFDLFLTFTCNQSTHPGNRQAPRAGRDTNGDDEESSPNDGNNQMGSANTYIRGG